MICLCVYQAPLLPPALVRELFTRGSDEMLLDLRKQSQGRWRAFKKAHIPPPGERAAAAARAAKSFSVAEGIGLELLKLGQDEPELIAMLRARLVQGLKSKQPKYDLEQVYIYTYGTHLLSLSDLYLLGHRRMY